MSAKLNVPTLKELEKGTTSLFGGHSLCAGCAESIIVRQVLDAGKYSAPEGETAGPDNPYPLVAGVATGCLEVSTTPCPYTSWGVPLVHVAFENIAAVMSGLIAAYEVLRKRGKFPGKEKRFVAFGGDGATYDIGFQALSAALERMLNFVYVCLNNEGYMNTGIQVSSATPFGAWTTTSYAGKVEWRKDLTSIIVAHGIPYVAQAAPFSTKPRDLYEKTGRAFAAKGPSFINVFSPCTRGSRFPESETVKIARLAVDSCYWPLFEVVEGKLSVTYKPKNKIPVIELLSAQDKFKNIVGDKEKVGYIQNRIDGEWEALLAKDGKRYL